MFKQKYQFLSVLILAGILVACSSPEEKAAKYIENAEILLEEGKLKKAEVEYKNALQINQNLPDAWFGLAKINERKQEWRKLYAVLNKIRETSPRHVNGRIMLAQMLLASNQLDQTLADAREIMEMAPADARAHSLMAAVQFRLENFEGARQEIDKALAIDPANGEAILVRARVLIAEKKYNEALGVLDKAITENPENVSMYLMKTQIYQETNDQKATETVYLELIAQFPENTAFKRALARIYLEDKNIDAAEGMLTQIAQVGSAKVEDKLRLVAFKNQYRSVDDAIALVNTYTKADSGEYRYRFFLGELYEANQQTERAQDVYRTIIADDELKPSGLDARNRIALIEMQAGNRDKAEILVKEVLTQDKNNENALLMQAGFQIADQKFDDTIVSARTVLRDNPESIKAFGLLGRAYHAKGSNELAIEAYTFAFKLSPGDPTIANQLARILMRQRNISQADEVLRESFAKGNRSLGVLKLLTQVNLSLGKWDQAEQLAKELQKFEGQEAVSQQLLGVVYRGKQQQDASIDAFKRAYELAPSAVQPIVALVQTYMRLGKIEEARRFLESVLSVHSDNVTAYTLLGDISFHEKKTSEAIKFYQKAIEINPKLDTSYRALASIYMKGNEYIKAINVINQGLAEMPGRPMLAMYLASIYEKQGNFGKAVEIYESVLAENANLIVVKNNLASLLTDHGGDQASLDKARTLAVALRESQIPQFRDTYAWASVRSGTNLEEAVVILEGIVKDNGQVDVYNYHLGEAYRKKGETDNAIAYLQKAVELAKPGSDIADKANQSLQKIN